MMAADMVVLLRAQARKAGYCRLRKKRVRWNVCLRAKLLSGSDIGFHHHAADEFTRRFFVNPFEFVAKVGRIAELQFDHDRLIHEILVSKPKGEPAS